MTSKTMVLARPQGIEKRLSDRFYPTAILMMYSNGAKQPIEIVEKHCKVSKFGKYLMDNMKSDYKYLINNDKIELVREIAVTNGDRDKLIEKI